MKFKTEQELLEYTSNIIGKTFEEIDSKKLLEKYSLKRRKGLLGQIVETGFYKYPLNNNSQADFEELGIELKVTGYVRNKNGNLRAKERLVLSKIDYNKIIYETYEESHVLGKCKKMLIIWYEYDSKKEVKDFTITDYQLYDMSKDELIFKNDFEIIRGKVIDGKAHELSEGDTSYLGACTKSAKSTDRTEQPFSYISAKPRAFSLKNAYMTGILQDLHKQPTLMTFTPEYKTVEEYVLDKLEPYIGKTQIEIYEEIIGDINLKKIPKNINKHISDRLIGKDNELPFKNELFRKTNFIIKNIPLRGNGTVRERMSFKTISISDFDEKWENSYWKNYFEEIKIITICYEEKNKSKNGYRTLKSVKRISFDDEDLESFEKTYNQLRLAIELKDINLLPTPNSFKNQLLEIAPKGKKGDDAYNNFFKNDKTKVAFMISKKLLNKKISESH